MSEPGTDLDIVDGMSVVNVEEASFEQLMHAANGEYYVIPGLSLHDKSALVGVPFIITRVTFRPVPEATKQIKHPGDFASIEATVANALTLKTQIQYKRISDPTTGRTIEAVEELPFEPGERIVFNDGSTGVRRQLVQIFDGAGLITVGALKEYGEITNAYDMPWTKWDDVGEQINKLTEEGIATPTIDRNPAGNQLLIVARRGLRVSTYAYGNDMATTYYLS